MTNEEIVNGIENLKKDVTNFSLKLADVYVDTKKKIETQKSSKKLANTAVFYGVLNELCDRLDDFKYELTSISERLTDEPRKIE